MRLLLRRLRAAVHRNSLSDWIAVESDGWNRMLRFIDAESAAAAYARAGVAQYAAVVDDAGTRFYCIDTRYPADPVDRDRPPWWLALAAWLLR